VAEDPHKFTTQITLLGRAGWVLQQLSHRRGAGDADAAKWVIDQWIEGEGRSYLESFAIDLADYPPADVRPIDSERQRDRKG
jgi:hypothetical protein